LTFVPLLTSSKGLGNLCEKLRAKFPPTTLGHSMVRISCIDNALSGILELKASPVEGKQLPQKENKRRKRKGNQKNLETYLKKP